MAESEKSRRGRKPILTDSARKRQRNKVTSNWNKTRINIGEQMQRWNALKIELGASSHREVAEFLLDRYDQSTKVFIYTNFLFCNLLCTIYKTRSKHNYIWTCTTICKYCDAAYRGWGLRIFSWRRGTLFIADTCCVKRHGKGLTKVYNDVRYNRFARFIYRYESKVDRQNTLSVNSTPRDSNQMMGGPGGTSTPAVARTGLPKFQPPLSDISSDQ